MLSQFHLKPVILVFFLSDLSIIQPNCYSPKKGQMKEVLLYLVHIMVKF